MGKDTQEAMLKVKMDLGSDAIILNTRKVKQKGLLNFFSKPLVEVLAAIDEGAEKPASNKSSKNGNVQEYKIKSAQKQKPANHKASDVRYGRDEHVYYEQEQPENGEKIELLENKVNRIESLLQKIYQNIKGNQEPLAIQEDENKVSGIMKIFENNLISNSVEPSIVQEIIGSVKEIVTDHSSINEIAVKMYNTIVGILDTPEAIQLNEDGTTRVVIFTGPTGVGKTTTLAKIAANFSINHKKSIGIISSDTYRIAAVEQLKTYTEILGLPINVVYSPEEIGNAIDQFRDKDLILIDTAGRSHKDAQQFDELKKIIELSKPQEIFLLLSSTTDYKVCKEIIGGYSFLKNYKIIITKLDETSSQGVILNLKKLTNKCLSYITTGQSVPDDIEIANTDKITKKIMGSIQI